MKKKMSLGKLVVREAMKGKNPFIYYTTFDKWCRQWFEDNIEQLMAFVGIEDLPEIRFATELVIQKGGVMIFGLTEPVGKPYDHKAETLDTKYMTDIKFGLYNSVITLNTYNMLMYRGMVSKAAKMLFISSVVHELTHYKQLRNDPVEFCNILMNSYIEVSKETQDQYRSQTLEAEAIEAGKNFLRYKGIGDELIALTTF